MIYPTNVKFNPETGLTDIQLLIFLHGESALRELNISKKLFNKLRQSNDIKVIYEAYEKMIIATEGDSELAIRWVNDIRTMPKEWLKTVQ